MAEGNVELTRRMIKAFNERDVDAIADRITDDFEFIPYLATLIETSTYRGRAGLRKYLEDADAAWGAFEMRADEIRDLGDRVVVFGEIHGRGRASGMEVRVPLTWVLDFRDGKLRRNQTYADRGEALEAAGLSE